MQGHARRGRDARRHSRFAGSHRAAEHSAERFGEDLGETEVADLRLDVSLARAQHAREVDVDAVAREDDAEEGSIAAHDFELHLQLTREGEVGVELHREVRLILAAEVVHDVERKVGADKRRVAERVLDRIDAEDHVHKLARVDRRAVVAPEAELDGRVQPDADLVDGAIGIDARPLAVHGARGEGTVDRDPEVAELERERDVRKRDILAHDLGRVDGISGAGRRRIGRAFSDELEIVGIQHVLALIVAVLGRRDVIRDAFRHLDIFAVFAVLRLAECGRVRIAFHFLEVGLAVRVDAGELIAGAQPHLLRRDIGRKAVFRRGDDDMRVVLFHSVLAAFGVRVSVIGFGDLSRFVSLGLLLEPGVGDVAVRVLMRDHASLADELVEVVRVDAVDLLVREHVGEDCVVAIALHRGEQIAVRGVVVKAAVDAELHLQAERAVAEEDVGARGAARHVEGGQQMELIGRELGHSRPDETREDVLRKTHGEHVVCKQHFAEEEVKDAPNVLGDEARVLVADVDDDAAVRSRHRGVVRVVTVALLLRACEQIRKADQVLDLDALREEVADGIVLVIGIRRDVRHFAEAGRDEIDVEEGLVRVGDLHPQLDGSSGLDVLAVEVGVDGDLEIDLRAAEDGGQHAHDVHGALGRVNEPGQSLEQTAQLQLQREVNVKTDRGHEFRAVHRHGGEQHREVVVRAAVHREEFGHLARPVERVAEGEVKREARADLHRLDARLADAFQDETEDVDLHCAALALAGLRVIDMLMIGIIGVARGAQQCVEVEAEQRRVVAEDGALDVSAVAVGHVVGARRREVDAVVAELLVEGAAHARAVHGDIRHPVHGVTHADIELSGARLCRAGAVVDERLSVVRRIDTPDGGEPAGVGGLGIVVVVELERTFIGIFRIGSGRPLVVLLVTELDVSVVAGAALDGDIALGGVVVVAHGGGGDLDILRAVVELVDGAAIRDDHFRFCAGDRRILLARGGHIEGGVVVGVVHLIRSRTGVERVIVDIVVVAVAGVAREDARKLSRRDLVVVLLGAEAELETRRRIGSAEEVQRDAEVEEPGALLVIEGGADGDVVRRGVDVHTHGNVGHHLIQRGGDVGRKQPDDELEEARARLQRELAGVEVEQHRDAVGVADIGDFRSGDRLAAAFVAFAALLVSDVIREHAAQHLLKRVVAEVHLHFRGGSEDPAQVEIEPRALRAVVGVVVVVDVELLALVVQPEDVGESVVIRLGAPQIDGKLQARDIEVIVRLGGISDLDRRADLEGQHSLVAVRHREERVHVAEDRPQHFADRRRGRGVRVILGHAAVLRRVVLDILPSHEDVRLVIAGHVAEAFRLPLTFGEIGDVLAQRDGAADGDVDVIQLAGVAVEDLGAVVVSNITVLVAVHRDKVSIEVGVLARNSRVSFSRRRDGHASQRLLVVDEGGRVVRTVADNDGVAFGVGDGLVILREIDGELGFELTFFVRIDNTVTIGVVGAFQIIEELFACIRHGHIPARLLVVDECGVFVLAGGDVEVVDDVVHIHPVFGHRHERGGRVADIVAARLADIAVDGVIDLLGVEIRRLDGHIHDDAVVLRIDLDEVSAVDGIVLEGIGLLERRPTACAHQGIAVIGVVPQQGAGVDRIIAAAVVDVVSAVCRVAVADDGFRGLIDHALFRNILSALSRDLGVAELRGTRHGRVDVEGEVVTPQPDVRLHKGLHVLGGIDHEDGRIGAELGITVTVAVLARVGRPRLHIELVGADEIPIAEVARIGVAFRTHPIGVGRLGGEDVVTAHMQVGLDGRDVVVAVFSCRFVVRDLRRRHVGAELHDLLARQRIGVDPIHTVHIVSFDGEAGVGELDLLRGRCGEVGVEIVVEVDVDAHIGLLEGEVLVKDGTAGEQGEDLGEEVALHQDPDVGGRDAGAVHERRDVGRDLLAEQRQRVGEVDVSAEEGAEVVRQREAALRAFRALRGLIRRGDRFAEGDGELSAHPATDERQHLADVDEHTGLTEVAEVDIKTRIFAHSVAVRIGIEEGVVTGISAVHLFVVTRDVVDEHVAVILAVGGVGVHAHIAVDSVLGREVVRITRGSDAALIIRISSALVVAQAVVDAEHGMRGHAVVGDGRDLHGRIDEVEDVIKTEEVVHLRVGVIDAACRIGHLLGADEAADDIDEGDEVDVAGEALERYTDLFAIFRLIFIAQVIPSRQAAQVVDERAQLELQRHGDVDVAQDVVDRFIAALHADDGGEVAVREEVFEDGGEVDLLFVRKQQTEGDGLAQRHGVQAVELIEVLQLLLAQSELALLGEVHVDGAHVDVEGEHGVVVVGVGARACLEPVDSLVGGFDGFALRVHRGAFGRGDCGSARPFRLHLDVGVGLLVEEPGVGVGAGVGVGVIYPVSVVSVDFFRLVSHEESVGGGDVLGGIDLRPARLAVAVRRAVVEEEPLIGFVGFVGGLEHVEHEEAFLLRLEVDLDELVAVAFQHELRADADVESFVEVDGDVETALELLIDEHVERVVAYGEEGEQISHHRVADGDRQLALADEQRRHLVLGGDHVVFGGRGIVCGDRLRARAAHFDVLINGAVKQVTDEIPQHIGDLRHGHRQLGQTEEGEVDVEHLVEVVRRKPTHFRAGLGREVVKLDHDLGRRQVERIEHEGEVQTQVRRGVALVGARDLDDQPFEVSEDGGEDLTDVDVALGDGELELHRSADGHDGVIERHEREVLIIDRALALVRFGHERIGARRLVVGVVVFAVNPCRGRLGLARGDVGGDDGLRPAELETDAAQRETHSHRAHFRTQREVELVEVGVRMIDAQEVARLVTHIAVLAVVGEDAVLVGRDLDIAACDADIDRCACRDFLKVGDDVIATARRLGVEDIVVAVEIFRAAVDFHFHISAVQTDRPDELLLFLPPVTHAVGDVEVAVLRLIIQEEVFGGSGGFRGGSEGVLSLLGAVREHEADDVAAVVPDGDIFAVYVLCRRVGRALDVDIVMSADVHAEGHFEAVEDVRDGAEVGHQRRQQRADDGLGDDDLHRRVGIDEIDQRVAHHGLVAFRSGHRRSRGKRLRGGALPFFPFRGVVFVAAAVVAAELDRTDDEGQEVGDIGVVLHHIEDAGAVKIERAAGEIDAREHVVHDVARSVDVEKFQRRLDGVEVGFFEECLRLCVRIREAIVEQRLKAQFAEVRIDGEVEADAVREGAVRLDVERDVLQPLRKEGADVIAAVAQGLELRFAGDGEGDLLRSECQLAVADGLVIRLAAIDHVDNGGRQRGHVDEGALLAHGEQSGVARRDFDLQTRLRRNGDVEARVGARGHHEFDAVAAADVEADLAFVLVQHEVLKDIAFLRARDESHQLAQHVGRQHDIQTETALEDVAADHSAEVGAEHDRTHQRVEHRVDGVGGIGHAALVALAVRGVIAVFVLFTAGDVDMVGFVADVAHAVGLFIAICVNFIDVPVLALLRRGDRFAAAAAGVEHSHLVEDLEQFHADAGTAQSAEVDIEVAVDEIDRDGRAVHAVLGVEDEFQPDLQRIEDGLRVKFGHGESAEDVCETQRLQVEKTGDPDVEVVTDGVVKIELHAEGGEQHFKKSRDVRLIGIIAHLIESVRDGVHAEQRAHHVGQSERIADVGPFGILYETAVGQQLIPLGLVVSREFLGVGDLLIGGVRAVFHAQRDAESCKGADARDILVVARVCRLVDGFGDLLVRLIGDVGLYDREAERRILGVGGDRQTDGILKADVHGHVGVQSERFEDLVDVHFLSARDGVHDAEQHRFRDAERKVSLSRFEDDVEGFKLLFLRALPFRGGDRFAAADATLAVTREQLVDLVEQELHHSGARDIEVVLGQHAHVDIELVAPQISGEDDVAAVLGGAVAVADDEGDLGLLRVRKIDVGAEVDGNAHRDVIVDDDAGAQRKVGYEVGEDVAHGQFAVREVLGAKELEVELDGGIQRDHAVRVEDALVVAFFKVIGLDGLVRVIDRGVDAAEREPDGDGIHRDGKIQTDVTLIGAVTLAVEQREIALLGVELGKVLRVDARCGEQHVDERSKEVGTEAHPDLLIRHIDAVQDAEDAVQDAEGIIIHLGAAVVAQTVRSLLFGCVVYLVDMLGAGGLAAFRDVAFGGGDRLLAGLTACRGLAAAVLAISRGGEQSAEVDARHHYAAADETAFGRIYVEGAAPRLFVRDYVQRDELVFTLKDLQRDVGVREDVSRDLIFRKGEIEAEQRAQLEIELRAYALLHRKGDDELFDERFDLGVDPAFRGIPLALNGDEGSDPASDGPLLLAIGGACTERDGAFELRINGLDLQARGVEIAVRAEQTAEVGELVKLCLIGNDGRRSIKRRLAETDGQRRERDADVADVACGNIDAEEILVRCRIRLVHKVAPVEAESGFDLAKLHADGVFDDLGQTFRKLEDEALGSDSEQQLERTHIFLGRHIVVARRGDRGCPAFSAAFTARGLIDEPDEELHDVKFDAYARAQERVCVNIENAALIVRREEHFVRAVGVVEDLDRKLRPVLALGLHSRERSEQRRNVKLAVHGKDDVDAHRLGEGDLTAAVADGDIGGFDVRLDAELQPEVDVGLVDEVDECLVIDGRIDAALPVDGGVDAAEGEVEVEVVAHAEHDAHGKTLGSVPSRDLQTVCEVDADARFQTELFARGVRDGQPFNVGKREEHAEKSRAESEVEIEVADIDIRRRDDGEQFRRDGDGHLAAADITEAVCDGIALVVHVPGVVDMIVDGAGHLLAALVADAVAVFVHMLAGSLGRAARLVRGDGFARAGGGQEGLDVHLQLDAAQDILRSLEIDHAVREPDVHRCRAVLGEERHFEVECGEQRPEKRADVRLGAFGCVRDRCDGIHQRRNVQHLRLDGESRPRPEGLGKLCEHGEDELAGFLIVYGREGALDGADVDVRFETDLERLDAREDLRDVKPFEAQVAVLVEEGLEGREFYVFVVLSPRGESRDLAVEVVFVFHRAEARADAHADFGEQLLDFLTARGVVEVDDIDAELDQDVLGLAEAVVGDGQLHAVAGDGDGPARGVAFIVHEDEAPDVVQDLLREGHTHLFEVEDVARHLHVDVLEDGFDETDGVEDGFAFRGGAHGAHHCAVRDGCLCLLDESRHLLLLFRKLCAALPAFLIRGSDDAVVDKGFLHHRDEVVDESAEHLVEVDAVYIELARAEQAGEVDIKGLVRANIAYARAHVVVFVRTGELDEQVGAVIVEHVDAAADVNLKRPCDIFRDVYLLVEERVEGLGGHVDAAEHARDERPEGGNELIGSDLHRLENKVERDGEVDGEGRILIQHRKVEPPAAVGLGLTLRRLGRGEIALDVDLLIETVVPLQAGAAHIEGDAALLDAVVLLEAGAECVVIEADAHIHARELAPAAVVGGEVRGNVDGKPLHRGEQPEVDAEDALHHVVNFGGDETVFARRKNPAEHAAQYVGKPDGHDDGLRAVGVGCDAGSADERGDRAADHAYDAAFGGEDVIEKELCKALVFIAAGRSEKFAQSLHHGSGVDVVGLDNGGAGFQTGAVIDEGGVEIIDAEEHLDEVAVDVPLPQLEEGLVARVVFEIDVRLDLKGVGIGHRIFDIIEIDDVVQSDQTPRVGVGRLRRVDHHIPCIRPADGLHLLGLSRLSGLRRRDGRDVVPAVRRRVACHKHRRRKAENEHE